MQYCCYLDASTQFETFVFLVNFIHIKQNRDTFIISHLSVSFHQHSFSLKSHTDRREEKHVIRNVAVAFNERQRPVSFPE